MKKDTMIRSKSSSGKIALTAAALFVALLFIAVPAAAAWDQTATCQLTLSLSKVTVSADSGISYTINGQQVSTVLLDKEGKAVINVTALPAGSTLKAAVSTGGKLVLDGNKVTVTIDGQEAEVTVTLSAVSSGRSSGHSSSGGASTWATSAPTTTSTPGPTPGAVETPGVNPIDTPSGSSAKTPAPFLGILAGLGAAAVLFGLRR